MPFAGDGLGNIQFTDFKFSNIDIEVGQQGAFGRRGQKFGHAQKFRLGHDQRANIYMTSDKGQGPPVHFDCLCGCKNAFGIPYFEIDNFHLAINRAIDPADFELHAIFELKRFDLLFNEAMTAAAIEPDIARRHQNQQERNQRAQTDDKFIFP